MFSGITVCEHNGWIRWFTNYTLHNIANGWHKQIVTCIVALYDT